jgi:uncharacterized protein YbaR (Trm112 family)
MTMSEPLDRSTADELLAEAELLPAAEGGLRDLKELEAACLQAGIPAMLGAEACAKPGCSPKGQLLIRTEDKARLGELMRSRWNQAVADLGVDPAALAQVEIPEEGELPCPACGTAAPLVEGACSDCGLQLE